MSDAELFDTAKVIAARERVMETLGQVAAAPLDEDNLDALREAIAHAKSPKVRSALRRLDAPDTSARHLSLVQNVDATEQSGVSA